MSISKWASSLVLALAAHAACALPVSGVDGSGEVGQQASVALKDGSSSDLLQALGFQVKLSFNATYLSFGQATSGMLGLSGGGEIPLFDPIVTGSGTDFVDVAFAFNFDRGIQDPLFEGTPIDDILASFSFTILAMPPGGSTNVDFLCIDRFNDEGENIGCDYRIDTLATIAVSERQNIPLPGSLPLVLLGLAGLVAARRRV